MQIALLRHGIARDVAATDRDRALTAEGRAQIERVIARAASSGWRPGCILHSPYARTTESARVAHARFPDVGVWPIDELAGGTPAEVLHVVARFDDPLLVGHHPTIGEIAARLLGAPAGALPFGRATFAWLDVDRLPATRPARLLAFLPAEMA